MNVTMGRIFLMERRTRAFYGVEFSLVMGKHFEFLCTPGKKITQGRISVMGGNLYISRSRKNVEPWKGSKPGCDFLRLTGQQKSTRKSQHKTKINTKKRSMQKSWHKTKVNAKKIDKNKSQHEKVDTKQKPIQNKGQHKTKVNIKQINTKHEWYKQWKWPIISGRHSLLIFG